MPINKNAQSLMEYSVLIACIAAALLSIEIYTKRAIEGRVRQAGDDIGWQYSPKSTTGFVNIKVEPNEVKTESQLFWLKYPNGSFVSDSFGLPVYGVESNTTFSENTVRGTGESIGPFEASLF